MCFISSYKPKPLVAHTDLKCYKIVDKGYKVIESVKTVVYIPLLFYWTCKYQIGVRMPSIKLEPIRELTASNPYNTMLIHRGYHSFMPKRLKELKEKSISLDSVVGLFIIPKGSNYYLDREEGVYVSETIKMVKEVKCVS
jgi:hypothetical protein